ncbi:MAG: M20/M25/M40 family metallo-hydrolase [Pirellulaceae bacterium]|nr:M20/M25/M40 family metallo-hydrolase [Pirellulaceae bacterium]
MSPTQTTRLRADDAANLAAAAARVSGDLSFLASDELAGRGVGSEGIAQAGEFIAKRFSELGFKTDAFDGKPFQSFGIGGPVVLGPAEQNRLSFNVNGQAWGSLKLGTDFTPMALGRSGKFNGQVAFAGYGITAKDFDYDDYASFDPTGKVVIVLRKEPQQTNASSVFNGLDNSEHAFFGTKETNAASHKAAAVIMVNDALTVSAAIAKLDEDLTKAQQRLDELKQTAKPSSPADAERLETRLRIATQQVEALNQKKAAGGGDALVAVDGAGKAMSDQSIPTFYCTRELANGLIMAGCGQSLAELEEAIDRDGKPHSVLLTGVEASGEVALTTTNTQVRNVIAVMPGAGALAEEYVVVGAHYDHVGMGGAGSLAPGTIAVHNGADDNGSGTVTMLEVARQLSENPSANRRSVIFMAFTAEESGLLGSAHYVRNPRWPLEKTVAMVNLDMVGRLLNDELTVYGTGTAVEFPGLLDRLNEQYKFRIVKVPQGRGASDHASFYNVKVPVFHFFTGLHNEYHRPSDDVELINISGIVRISRLVADVTREIAESTSRPQLLDVKGSAAPRSQTGAGRATLGVRLDRNLEAPARLSEVIEGGPGATAGLQSGDTIVSINGTAVDNIGQFRNEMNKLKSGQTATFGFKRENEMKTVDVKLGE